MAPQDMGEAHIPATTHTVIIRSDEPMSCAREVGKWLAAEESLFNGSAEHLGWRFSLPPHAQTNEPGRVVWAGCFHPLTADRLRGEA